MNHAPIPRATERFVVIFGYIIDLIVFFLLMKTDSGCWPFALILPGQIVVYNYIDARNKQSRCNQYTKARIVDTVSKIGGSLYRRWTKFPIVEFEVNGRICRGEGNEGSTEYRVGDEVWIYFNPEKPSEIAQSFPYANRDFCIAGVFAWCLGLLWAVGNMSLSLI